MVKSDASAAEASAARAASVALAAVHILREVCPDHRAFLWGHLHVLALPAKARTRDEARWVRVAERPRAVNVMLRLRDLAALFDGATRADFLRGMVKLAARANGGGAISNDEQTLLDLVTRLLEAGDTSAIKRLAVLAARVRRLTQSFCPAEGQRF